MLITENLPMSHRNIAICADGIRPVVKNIRRHNRLYEETEKKYSGTENSEYPSVSYTFFENEERARAGFYGGVYSLMLMNSFTAEVNLGYINRRIFAELENAFEVYMKDVGIRMPGFSEKLWRIYGTIKNKEEVRESFNNIFFKTGDELKRGALSKSDGAEAGRDNGISYKNGAKPPLIKELRDAVSVLRVLKQDRELKELAEKHRLYESLENSISGAEEREYLIKNISEADEGFYRSLRERAGDEFFNARREDLIRRIYEETDAELLCRKKLVFLETKKSELSEKLSEKIKKDFPIKSGREPLYGDKETAEDGTGGGLREISRKAEDGGARGYENAVLNSVERGLYKDEINEYREILDEIEETKKTLSILIEKNLSGRAVEEERGRKESPAEERERKESAPSGRNAPEMPHAARPAVDFDKKGKRDKTQAVASEGDLRRVPSEASDKTEEYDEAEERTRGLYGRASEIKVLLTDILKDAGEEGFSELSEKGLVPEGIKSISELVSMTENAEDTGELLEFSRKLLYLKGTGDISSNSSLLSEKEQRLSVFIYGEDKKSSSITGNGQEVPKAAGAARDGNPARGAAGDFNAQGAYLPAEKESAADISGEISEIRGLIADILKDAGEEEFSELCEKGLIPDGFRSMPELIGMIENTEDTDELLEFSRKLLYIKRTDYLNARARLLSETAQKLAEAIYGEDEKSAELIVKKIWETDMPEASLGFLKYLKEQDGDASEYRPPGKEASVSEKRRYVERLLSGYARFLTDRASRLGEDINRPAGSIRSEDFEELSEAVIKAFRESGKNEEAETFENIMGLSELLLRSGEGFDEAIEKTDRLLEIRKRGGDIPEPQASGLVHLKPDGEHDFYGGPSDAGYAVYRELAQLIEGAGAEKILRRTSSKEGPEPDTIYAYESLRPVIKALKDFAGEALRDKESERSVTEAVKSRLYEHSALIKRELLNVTESAISGTIREKRRQRAESYGGSGTTGGSKSGGSLEPGEGLSESGVSREGEIYPEYEQAEKTLADIRRRAESSEGAGALETPGESFAEQEYLNPRRMGSGMRLLRLGEAGYSPYRDIETVVSDRKLFRKSEERRTDGEAFKDGRGEGILSELKRINKENSENFAKNINSEINKNLGSELERLRRELIKQNTEIEELKKENRIITTNTSKEKLTAHMMKELEKKALIERMRRGM